MPSGTVVVVRKILVLVAIGWVGVSLAAAWISVDREIPYSLTFVDGAGLPGEIGEDWLAGWGTGLAAPLAAVAAVGLLTALSSLDNALGRAGCLLLAVSGAGSIGFMLADRPARKALEDAGSQSTEAWLAGGTIALAALMVLTGVIAYITAPRAYYL